MVIFFASGTFASGIVNGQSSKQEDAQIPIVKALRDVSKIYDTKFVYEKSLLEGKTTSFTMKDIKKGKKVEDILKSILYPEKLVFLYIKDNYYTIVSRDRLEQQHSYMVTNKNMDIPKDQMGNSSAEYSTLQNLSSVLGNVVNHNVSGQVKNSEGKPMAGVSVVVENGNGTTTDELGRYTLRDVPDNATLIFSYVGFITQRIPVEKRSVVDVILSEGSTGLNEVVVVGYGTQKRETITGSISSVQGDELTVAPSANVTNTLAGRLPGLVSLQSSGQPGFDKATLSIRGFGQPLVIIDGVEGDFNTLDPTEVASVSILKDGAASIYGARAGNGVILVTTKRGVDGKPVISLNSSYTIQGITTMPKPVNAGQQAELMREAYLQSGQPPANVPWTEEEVEKFYKGDDPQYPSTNWYNELIRKWAPMWQHSISVRGGSDRIKYYGYLGYEDQKTLWKKSGGNYNRYNLLSNVDAKISKNFSMELNLASTQYNRKYPPRLASTTGVNNAAWEDLFRTLPTYPATLPDPTKNSFADGGGTGGAQMVTNMDIAGYAKSVSQDLKGTIALNYKSLAVNGLSGKIFFNYFQNYTTGTTFQKSYQYYTYDYETKAYSLAGGFSPTYMAVTDSKNRQITGQISLNYDRTFAQDHHLKVLALYEGVDYYSDYLYANRTGFMTTAIDQLYAGNTQGSSNNGSASIMGRSSFVGRINYSYKDKYLFESIFRADASAKFPPNKRWGFFPSISAGWRISQENFLQNLTALDELKLRASYGSAGNDGVGNFQYLAGYQIASNTLSYAGSYLFGTGGGQPLIISTGLPNPNLTWEKIRIYDIGLDFSLWNRKLYGTGDIFYRTQDGIPATALTSLPASFGATLPPENLNSLNNRGFELQIGTSGSKGEFRWDVSGNISWSRAKWGHYEEPEYIDPDQKRIYQRSGNWTDDVYGYMTDGLFTSQKEIDDLGFNQDNNMNNPNSSLRPGDLRYKDINGDSILNWRDNVLIGKGTTPHWMFGFNINLSYKNFDLSGLFQGAFGYYKDLNLSLGSVYTTSQYNERWTIENNNPHALLPRLGGSGAGFSDYKYKKASYLRLKTFSLGYNLPDRLIRTAGLDHIRFYVAGMNLLTFDKLKKYKLDPEAPSGMSGTFYYPQQRTISFGANISF
jgi:TonB-linked SusC/RagA family outer membrane protein